MMPAVRVDAQRLSTLARTQSPNINRFFDRQLLVYDLVRNLKATNRTSLTPKKKSPALYLWCLVVVRVFKMFDLCIDLKTVNNL